MTGRDSATADLGRALNDVLVIVGFLRGKAPGRGSRVLQDILANARTAAGRHRCRLHRRTSLGSRRRRRTWGLKRLSKSVWHRPGGSGTALGPGGLAPPSGPGHWALGPGGLAPPSGPGHWARLLPAPGRRSRVGQLGLRHRFVTVPSRWIRDAGARRLTGPAPPSPLRSLTQSFCDADGGWRIARRCDKSTGLAAWLCVYSR